MFDKVFNEFDAEISKAEISMTPLIDMVFLLLIFFAVTTNFTKETGITVDKASAVTARILNKDIVMVAIDSKGAYWYDGRVRPAAEVVTLVKEDLAGKPEMNVVLLPDKNGRIEPLIKLMDAFRMRGINRFSIGTRKETEK
jgi:biopolymer transport protein ExbD